MFPRTARFDRISFSRNRWSRSSPPSVIAEFLIKSQADMIRYLRCETMDPESPIFLPAFRLPKDFAWQNGLVANIERYLVERRVPISYTIPRFVGYCYHKGLPVAYCRDVRSVLAITPLVEPLANDVRKITKGAFNITSGRDDG